MRMHYIRKVEKMHALNGMKRKTSALSSYSKHVLCIVEEKTKLGDIFSTKKMCIDFDFFFSFSFYELARFFRMNCVFLLFFLRILFLPAGIITLSSIHGC